MPPGAYGWLLYAYLDCVRELDASGRRKITTWWLFVLPALHLICLSGAVQKRRGNWIFAWGRRSLQRIGHARGGIHVLGRIRGNVVHQDEIQVGLLFVEPAIEPFALRFAVWANNLRRTGNEPAGALDGPRLEAQWLVEQHDPNHWANAALGGHRNIEITPRSYCWR